MPQPQPVRKNQAELFASINFTELLRDAEKFGLASYFQGLDLLRLRDIKVIRTKIQTEGEEIKKGNLLHYIAITNQWKCKVRTQDGNYFSDQVSELTASYDEVEADPNLAQTLEVGVEKLSREIDGIMTSYKELLPRSDGNGNQLFVGVAQVDLNKLLRPQATILKMNKEHLNYAIINKAKETLVDAYFDTGKSLNESLKSQLACFMLPTISYYQSAINVSMMALYPGIQIPCEKGKITVNIQDENTVNFSFKAMSAKAPSGFFIDKMDFEASLTGEGELQIKPKVIKLYTTSERRASNLRNIIKNAAEKLAEGEVSAFSLAPVSFSILVADRLRPKKKLETKTSLSVSESIYLECITGKDLMTRKAKFYKPKKTWLTSIFRFFFARYRVVTQLKNKKFNRLVTALHAYADKENKSRLRIKHAVRVLAAYSSVLQDKKNIPSEILDAFHLKTQSAYKYLGALTDREQKSPTSSSSSTAKQLVSQQSVDVHAAGLCPSTAMLKCQQEESNNTLAFFEGSGIKTFEVQKTRKVGQVKISSSL